MSRERDDLVAALRALNDARNQFAENKRRVAEYQLLDELPADAGHVLLGIAESLVRLLEAETRQNDRLTAFVMGLQEAGAISQGELDWVMGLAE